MFLSSPYQTKNLPVDWEETALILCRNNLLAAPDNRISCENPGYSITDSPVSIFPTSGLLW
ncbi:hypothetical protein CBD41_02215 [bacterium TMED181]|nr:hypothetical protein [Planctomycetota bacterium]OUW46740.1 MAG: hypothetical protein CBD41_02215 [bacterium TMED181]